VAKNFSKDKEEFAFDNAVVIHEVYILFQVQSLLCTVPNTARVAPA
jgi:hypothetical protein